MADAHIIGSLGGVRVIDRIHTAHELITPMRPRAQARPVLIYDDLAAAESRRVHAHITGFCGAAHRADAATLDDTVPTASGRVSIAGRALGTPLSPLHRKKIGQGEPADISGLFVVVCERAPVLTTAECIPMAPVLQDHAPRNPTTARATCSTRSCRRPRARPTRPGSRRGSPPHPDRSAASHPVPGQVTTEAVAEPAAVS
ncbi:hypothetical protein AB0478_41850 [Streptomyces sp. NPDC051917]|uniref:hypothetical protein n=1 Tax=Streptomyces sp. NPDC051917 TaxID=3154754 RepID=UPI0034546EAD